MNIILATFPLAVFSISSQNIAPKPILLFAYKKTPKVLETFGVFKK